MKTILLSIITMSFFCSCEVYQKMGKAPALHPKPFVLLKDKQQIEFSTVKAKKDSIYADSTRYTKNSVRKYSDGKGTYAWVGNKTFAKFSDSGDINAYTDAVSYTYGSYAPSEDVYLPGPYDAIDNTPIGSFHSRIRSSTVVYLQKGDTGSLQQFSYKTVQGILSPNEPAYKYLNMYKKEAWVATANIVGGFALFIGGIVLASNPPNGSLALKRVGLGSVFAGTFYYSRGFSLTRMKLKFARGAVAIHNGVAISSKRYRKRYYGAE